jgi:hypothetical protein
MALFLKLRLSPGFKLKIFDQVVKTLVCYFLFESVTFGKKLLFSLGVIFVGD